MSVSMKLFHSLSSGTKDSIDSSAARAKIQDEKRSSSSRPAADTNDVRNSMLDNENDRFIQNQKLTTKDVIKQQDQNLHILGQGVDRLDSMTRDINAELKSQNKELDGLEQDINTASDEMNTVQGALAKLLGTKDGCQIWTIVILALILVIIGK